MDFSDGWRSPWPVAAVFAVFAAPGLLPGGSRDASSSADAASASEGSVGPLLFFPHSPPLDLLSSASLSLRSPLPIPKATVSDGLRSFFCTKENDDFLPLDTIDAIAADIALSCSSADPFPSNNLVALRCHDPSSVILFFPTGSNADWVGYVGLSFPGGAAPPSVILDNDRDVFKQREGLKHPCHRILNMSAVSAASAPAFSWAPPEVMKASPREPLFEGFLLVATLYSLNWFRIETRVSDSGKERPSLVPLAKQGFENPVVHACWSPHLIDESAALLESGELCWFNLESKRGGRIMDSLDGEDAGEWLSCAFGGQPWTVIVACSRAVILVDLRPLQGGRQKILAKVEMPCLYDVAPMTEKNDRFVAFCKASYNDFHFSVATERQLHLFDIRRPVVPILTWDFILKRPRYISMFRLSELRPSVEFKWASQSGFVILVGSFWNDQFSLFCFGPKENGPPGNLSLYSWELPFHVSLSGSQCRSGNDLVRDIFWKETVPYGVHWQQSKNIIAGFYIVPSDMLMMNSSTCGFALIRLTLCGKLEMQQYRAYSMFPKESTTGAEQSEHRHKIMVCEEDDYDLPPKCFVLKFKYLHEHMNNNLLNALATQDPSSTCKAYCQVSVADDMEDFNKHIMETDYSSSVLIGDVGTPTSIFEIACRKILYGLPIDILSIAFSKYSNMFGMPSSNFEFLEVPKLLPESRLLSFFMSKPSGRGERWFRTSSNNHLVGPVLPVPALLTIQENLRIGLSSSFEIELGDNPLNPQCSDVLRNILNGTSVDMNRNPNEDHAFKVVQAQKPYFVYKHSYTCGNSVNNRIYTCGDNPLNPQCSDVLRNILNGTSVDMNRNPNEDHAFKVVQAQKPYFVYKHSYTCGNSVNNRIYTCGSSLSNRVGDDTKDKVKEEASGRCSTTDNDEKFSTFVCGVVDKKHEKSKDVFRDKLFDLSSIRLDFEPQSITLKSTEEKIFKCLKRQFSKWQENYKQYQNFCDSSKIPKVAH